MSDVKIQEIPMGVRTITNPNKAFSITMIAAKEAAKYIAASRKAMPLPRNRK